MDYLGYLKVSRRRAALTRPKEVRDLDIAIRRERKRLGLEADLHIVLFRLNLMTGMANTKAFVKAYEDAKRLADV